MKDLIKQFLATWLKIQFRDNPLVTNTSEYMGKVVAAVQVGLIGVIALIGLTILAIWGFTVGALKEWF